MNNKKDKTIAVRVGESFLNDLNIVREYFEESYARLGLELKMSDSDIIRSCVSLKAMEIIDKRK